MEINSISADGRSFTGPQAVGVFQAAVLLTSLNLYYRTGIKPTRGVGIKRMMALASEITGKQFKATKATIPAAVEALHVLIQASKAAPCRSPPMRDPQAIDNATAARVKLLLLDVFPDLKDDIADYVRAEDEGAEGLSLCIGDEYVIDATDNKRFQVSTVRHRPGSFNPKDGGTPPETRYTAIGGQHETLLGAVRAVCAYVATDRFNDALDEERIAAIEDE